MGLSDMQFSKRFPVVVVLAAAATAGLIFISWKKRTRRSSNLDCKSWKTSTDQHKTTLVTKSTCGRYYFLLVLVSSAPQNFERRNSIRDTWGTEVTASSAGPRWKTFFLLGQTRNQSLSDVIKREEKTFRDIVRGDYFEHYWNQSFKIEMGFEWAARYCNFCFLLKADDDVFVHTKDLVLYLKKASTPRKRFYMGKVQARAPVFRHGKFNVSLNEFSSTFYPDYCSGAGFVLSYDVVECLVVLFDVVNPFRIDDAYVGILANKAGISPVHHSWFLFPDSYYDDCYFVPGTLVQHRVTGQCLSKLYRMHSMMFHDYHLGSFY